MASPYAHSRPVSSRFPALRRRFLPGALVLAALAAPSAATAALEVARFGTATVALSAGRAFDGRRGEPNPFTGVRLSARVTAPGGRVYSVPGFFDGDGRGGMTGDVFKIRIFADEPGAWSWETASDLPALHGRRGGFVCRGRLHGPFGAGPVEPDPDRPRSFRHREGPSVYLLGKFLDQAAPLRLRYSHVLLSEELTEGDRHALVARHAAMRLNKVNLYLANRGDYGGVATTPWLGTAADNDKARFDLARWRLYEAWVQRLRARGMVAHFWFFADDSRFGDLPEDDRERLIAYGMARLSAYANTLFTLALEWQEGWSRGEVERLGRAMARANPWRRPLSVHGLTGDFAFPGSPWVDFMDLQAGNSATPEEVRRIGLANRALAAKPLLQEEFGLGREEAAGRRKAWAAFTAGAAGSGTGAYLAPLAEFAARVPFARMAPADGLVLSGTAWVLAEAGRAYAVYLPAGGEVRLDLRAAPGALAAEWLDPRAGGFRRGPDLEGGGVVTLAAPGGGDWALYLHRWRRR